MTATDTRPVVDDAKLEAFVGQAVTDMGAAISGLLLHIGDRLGLYKAMAGAAPAPPSAMSVNGCPTRQPVAMSSTTRTRVRSS